MCSVKGVNDELCPLTIRSVNPEAGLAYLSVPKNSIIVRKPKNVSLNDMFVHYELI